MRKTIIIFLLAFLTIAETTAFGAVTRMAPDFHNPGHIRMWNQSILQPFNPHIVMIVFGAIIIAGIAYYTYFKWIHAKEDAKIRMDKEETAFKQLIMKQNAIMEKVIELESAFEKGQIAEDEYSEKMKAYKHHLVKVKMSLRDYI